MDNLTAVQNGFDDRALGKAISVVERAHLMGTPLQEPLWTALPAEVQVIGVTGPPGAGKSTLVDKIIRQARAQDLRVGILAIDPSSPFTGGAILGDRVRMGAHAGDKGVFIRSMGSRSNPGGLAAATRSAVRLLAAHGADLIILETVGVGQAELAIMHVADTILVVVVPGLGDTVQMNKAGILEIGDVFVVNQADRPEAVRSKMELEQALMLGHRSNGMPPVVLTQATNGDGVAELWTQLRGHFTDLQVKDSLSDKRLHAQRQEIADECAKLLSWSLTRWIGSEEFVNLLASKPQAEWNVGDLSTQAMQIYLQGLQR